MGARAHSCQQQLCDRCSCHASTLFFPLLPWKPQLLVWSIPSSPHRALLMRFATVTAIPGQNDHGFLWNRVTLTKIEPRNPTTFTVCWCVVPTDWCGKSSCFIPRLRKTCRQAFSLRIGSPEIMGAHQRTHYQGIFPLKKLLNPQQLLGRRGFLDVL